jgi:RNA polymerase sigma-70 factor (ECF subfamily)
MQAELRRELSCALAQLNDSARQILVLRDIEGYSYEEIGAMLALRPSAVRMRIHRARAAFRDVIDSTTP